MLTFVNKIRKLNWTKTSGILITGFCLIAMLLARLIENYRGTWIYQYGAPTLLFAFYGGVFISFVNTILLLSKHNSELRNNLAWIILSAIPFLYIAIMITIAMIRTID